MSESAWIVTPPTDRVVAASLFVMGGGPGFTVLHGEDWTMSIIRWGLRTAGTVGYIVVGLHKAFEVDGFQDGPYQTLGQKILHGDNYSDEERAALSVPYDSQSCSSWTKLGHDRSFSSSGFTRSRVGDSARSCCDHDGGNTTKIYQYWRKPASGREKLPPLSAGPKLVTRQVARMRSQIRTNESYPQDFFPQLRGASGDRIVFFIKKLLGQTLGQWCGNRKE
ncbi:hypothetical protein PLEOSDRAFT_170641 [Pleurotus ostreatus PC15]|uniref:Uncharacterized protein n=1 Tax=Pleurotus ostreatus (strain PC15) TaxID=1137138 RepID=A0A067N8R8_PLEO1|nr:hypothetical protein PLEOSDRAFT_170641 [Pleurotus ostreatus PC15]